MRRLALRLADELEAEARKEWAGRLAPCRVSGTLYRPGAGAGERVELSVMGPGTSVPVLQVGADMVALERDDAAALAVLLAGECGEVEAIPGARLGPGERKT